VVEPGTGFSAFFFIPAERALQNGAPVTAREAVPDSQEAASLLCWQKRVSVKELSIDSTYAPRREKSQAPPRGTPRNIATATGRFFRLFQNDFSARPDRLYFY
jgi:hypothetical protein